MTYQIKKKLVFNKIIFIINYNEWAELSTLNSKIDYL